jgi:hypothetical protein
MPNNRKLIGLLIIVAGAIIILAIIYFIFWRQQPAATTTGGGTATTSQSAASETIVTPTTTPSDQPRNPQKYNIAGEPAHQFGTNDLIAMAKIFANRLGSYSSQSDYSNLTDLKIYMTDSLKSWADTYADQLRASHKSDSYYGITTDAIYATVKSFDDAGGQAEALVTTERRESTTQINGGQPFRQDLDLNFKKVNGQWLVDSAYWKAK